MCSPPLAITAMPRSTIRSLYEKSCRVGQSGSRKAGQRRRPGLDAQQVAWQGESLAARRSSRVSSRWHLPRRGAIVSTIHRNQAAIVALAKAHADLKVVAAKKTATLPGATVACARCGVSAHSRRLRQGSHRWPRHCQAGATSPVPQCGAVDGLVRSPRTGEQASDRKSAWRAPHYTISLAARRQCRNTPAPRETARSAVWATATIATSRSDWQSSTSA